MTNYRYPDAPAFAQLFDDLGRHKADYRPKSKTVQKFLDGLAPEDGDVLFYYTNSTFGNHSALVWSGKEWLPAHQYKNASDITYWRTIKEFKSGLPLQEAASLFSDITGESHHWLEYRMKMSQA